MSIDIRFRQTELPLPVLVCLCALTGACLAMWPLVTAGLLVSAGALLVLRPTAHPVTVVFLLFLVFQDPIQILAGGGNPLGLAIKRADEPLIVILGLACLLFDRTVQAAISHRNLLIAFTACFGGLILSSIPPVGLVASGIDLALFSKPFCLFVLGMSISVRAESIRRPIDTSLWIMLACILFGVVFLLAPQLQDWYIGDLRPPDERIGFLSAQGFFLGPGTYSWFAAASFGIAYSAYLVYKRSFYLVVSLTSAAFVVLSWRRKSILAVMAMALVSLLVRRDRGSRTRSIAVVGLAAVIAVTLFAPYADDLWNLTLTEYGSSNPYSTARAALYYTSLLIARDHFPLGTGLASFASHASKLYYSDVYQQYGLSKIYGLSPLDSDYITDTFWPMVLGEGGLICLTGYLLFFGILVTTNWRAARRAENDALSAFLATATLVLLVGSLLESTASHIYGASLQAALILVPAGMAWRAEFERSNQKRSLGE